VNAPKKNVVGAANDNRPRLKLLKIEIDLPDFLPVQLVEVEVFAEFLESLLPVANDNGDEG
jgi:hypothetical protein